jgi:hypothetical protein
MKTEEDEAFEAIERKQSGFKAKRAMAADKLQEPAQKPIKLWLWKNFVNGKFEYLAFDNPFPIFMDSHDPQTLGEPCGYALLKPSRAGRTDVSDEQVLQDVQKALAQPAQEPPSEWASIKAILDEYGLQAIDFVADFKEALAQPAQEPVAQGSKEHLKIMMEHSAWDDRLELSDALANIDEFYATAPPQRPWVGLTEKEAKSFISFYKMDIVRFVEAALKEKNNGA